MQRLSIAIVIAFLITGCSSQASQETQKQTPLATKEQTTTAPDGMYPASTRTGVIEIDRVLDVMAKKDAEELVGLVKLSKVVCMTQTSPGLVSCPQGKPDGTIVEVFGWSTSLAPQHFYELDQARDMVRNKLTAGLLYVYAVYRTNEGYTLILDDDKEDSFSEGVYLDDDGAIIAAYTHGAPAQAIPPTQNVFLLSPKSKSAVATGCGDTIMTPSGVQVALHCADPTPTQITWDLSNVQERLQSKGLNVGHEMGDYFWPLLEAKRFSIISVDKHPVVVYEYDDEMAAQQGLKTAEVHKWATKPEFVRVRNILLILPKADVKFVGKLQTALDD